MAGALAAHAGALGCGNVHPSQSGAVNVPFAELASGRRAAEPSDENVPPSAPPPKMALDHPPPPPPESAVRETAALLPHEESESEREPDSPGQRGQNRRSHGPPRMAAGPRSLHYSCEVGVPLFEQNQANVTATPRIPVA